ncbi:kinase-like protein [Xylona heveae TC161]|uniref:Kinase-like protein n=1 Tax=Xylona heveae (strain CBS 132557 / TC161) TaxID=1328760 RepID=A0A164ZV98_XYLHT|nr:kinase-like protein [Xylona heveae TC161]KZF19575.1 kinase-like protein [Xylona heveae TC161]
MDPAHLGVPQLKLDVTTPSRQRQDGKSGFRRCPPENIHFTGERRPLASRVWSSPPASPIFQQFSEQFKEVPNCAHGNFTPPQTPVQHQRRASFTTANEAIFHDYQGRVIHSDPSINKGQLFDPEARVKNAWEACQQPRICSREYEIRLNESSQREEFGRGAWSIVYKAECQTPQPKFQSSAPNLLSPPVSPIAGTDGCDRPTPGLVAVKSLARRDGQPVIEQEARILTYLQPSCSNSISYAGRFMTKFFGYDASLTALVLEAVPLTMIEYCEQQAMAVREESRRQRSMKPRVVVGMDVWLGFAEQLIDGLKYFHDHSVVHGDIKPMNILLRKGSGTHGLQPIYCDFSSSHVVHPQIEPERTTAWTIEFTAPEVLKSIARGDDVVATFSNDIFALGVSLLTPVMGNLPYAGASEFQKRSMAMQGTPLAFELPRPRDRSRDFVLIDKLLSAAVIRHVDQRVDASSWQSLHREIAREWKLSESANQGTAQS